MEGMTRRVHWLLPLLLALAIVRLWIMPLPSSFWLDETATVFVAQHGSSHPSLNAVAPQAWRSWYYGIIRVWGSIFGFSEIATRLPSVLAMLGFLAILARLSMRLIHRDSAWFAVFASLALAGFDYQAANARPYAVGMLLFAAALLFLIRWLDSGVWADALLFVACGASVLYIHLLFWPSCLVFFIYPVTRKFTAKTAVGWVWLVCIFLLWAAAIAPVLLDTVALLHEARAHVIAHPPTFAQLVRSLQLPLILICAFGTWLILRLRRLPPPPVAVSRPALALILSWWLCQPLLLFGFSYVTGDSVFVPRYLQLALPGAALAATAAAAPFISYGQWRNLSVVLGLGALLLLGQWRTSWPRHHNSDWRAAAAAVNSLQATGELLVLCPSPFIEARPPAWTPRYPLPGFLYAHLDVYRIRGRLLLLPFENSPESESFAIPLATALGPAHRFLIYGWEPQVHFWRDWFAARPELAHWSQRTLGPFADVDVVEFSAPDATSIKASSTGAPSSPRVHSPQRSDAGHPAASTRGGWRLLPTGTESASLCISRRAPGIPFRTSVCTRARNWAAASFPRVPPWRPHL